MTASGIATRRLFNQHLTRPTLTSPSDVVSTLGAIQAQDYAMAKWALGLRMSTARDETIEKAFNEGTILRTHVMRPTWHFVMPGDIRWMLELTSPRVKAFMAHYNRKLELDDALFNKSNAAIIKALHGHTYLTRKELKVILQGIGITTDVQRLAHIIMWAELDQLICSGPRNGKQFTYALLDERVPTTKHIDNQEALGKLALRYFTGHGPAQRKDYAWWSGLSVKDATAGLDLVKSKLQQETVDGKTYWFSSHVAPPLSQSPKAFLLSIYDEYTIAYKDRSALGGEQYVEKLLSMGNALTAVVILDGAIMGTWKRIIKKETVSIVLSLFRTVSEKERNALADAAHHYGTFLDMSVDLSIKNL